MLKILRTIGAVAIILYMAASIQAASAETKTYGVFSIDAARPDTITLNGEIDARAALNFRRALTAAPDARLVELDSPGGLVAIGLLIADDIHARRLNTVVKPGSRCFSACAYVFFAGAERQAEGRLGVHQIASDAPDLLEAQLQISDIIELFARFEVPVHVLTFMFRTPPGEMHVFSSEEVARLGINRPISATSIRQYYQRVLGDGSEASMPPVEERDGEGVSVWMAEPGSAEVRHFPPTPPEAAKFYEERTETAPGLELDASVVWSIVTEPPSPGAAAEAALRAVATVPDLRMTLTLTIRRNVDPTLPASHVIELMFATPPDFDGGSVANVQRLALKPTEQARGEPLVGVAGKISDGFFIIALNDVDQAVTTNLSLLDRERWIDIPLAYRTGRRALLSIKKGSGEALFTKVLEIWKAEASATR